MNPQRAGEDVLIKYLLGNLSEEEQVEIENRAFSDADYLGALEAAEADLIDTYVRGELAESERRDFERRFLSSARRRKKVEFAAALARVAAEWKTLENASRQRQTAWPSWIALVRGRKFTLRFAAGLATLLCLVGLSWLARENEVLRSRTATLEAERRDLENREQELRRKLSEEQDRTGSLTARQQQYRADRRAPVASLVLLPGLSRTQARMEQLLLDPSTQIVQIEIQLEARDAHPGFRAELRTRSGSEILTRSNLARRRSGAAYTLMFEVPASALGTGEYELALKGAAGNGSIEDIGYYYFAVRRD